MNEPPGTPQPKYFLSLVAPVRDEEAYLVEFVNYYLLQGVDHFYFYDNESKIPVDDVLRAYREQCTVLTALGDAVQSRACTHFSRRFRHETKWAAFFDVDEFVLPHRHATFRDFLVDYDHCDGIGINWVMFGDSNHKVPPAGNVIENYLYREAKQSSFIKSVVKGEKLVGFVDNPHFAQLVDGAVYLDAHMNPITSASNDHHTSDIIQLNHYFTKSELEWQRKLQRKRADSGRARADHVEDHGWVFTANRTLNQVKETTIVDRFGAPLAQRLALQR